jgi:glycerol kinase
VPGWVLALDQGTTSSRAIVFDERGDVRGVGQRAFRQIFPQPGWVEHDPEEIWQSQLAAARAALAQAGVAARELACIGITNQRETTLLWERGSGRPVANAIVWQCRRTAPLVEELRARGLTDLIRARTGLIPDAYFSATKIAWLLDHVPGARAAAERGDLAFGTVDTWLIWKLTGGAAHVTDRTNASRTMLLNLDTLRWDPDLLAALGVPAALLPEVRPSVADFGIAAPEWLGAAVPITGVAGDQQAALFGQGCVAPGAAKNTYGTGCFLLMHTGGRRIDPGDGLLATAAASADGTPQYALEGSVFVAGAAVQWLRDGLGIITSPEECEPLAASVPDSGGVVVVPAFTGLGAPHWDMYARGAILGLTRGSTRAHIARATLEAIALQTLDVVEAMERSAGQSLAELRVDGGGAANDLLMQIQADLLGRPVVRPAVTEITALGAASLAGLGAGVWPGTDVLPSGTAPARTFQPAMPAETRARLIHNWRRAVQRVKGWADA